MEINFTDSMEKALFRQYRHYLGHMENCLLLYFHLILVSVYVQWTRTKADGRLRVGGYPGNEGWSDQFLQSLNSLQHTFFPSRYFSEFLSFTLSTGLRRALTCSSSWISKLLIPATLPSCGPIKTKKLISWFLRYYRFVLEHQIIDDLSCFQRLSTYSKVSKFNSQPADCLSCDSCYHQLLTSISLDKTNAWLLQLSSR